MGAADKRGSYVVDLGLMADYLLLLTYGAVVFFFVWRYWKRRRPSSIGVALLPLGWFYVALLDLGALAAADGLIRLFGVGVGIYTLVTVVRAEGRDA